MVLFECAQKRAVKMIRGLEHLAYEDERVEVVQPREAVKRVLQRDLIEAFQYLTEALRKNEEGFLIRKCRDRMRGGSFKLE